MAEGIWLRVQQTGVQGTSLLLTDIDIGEGGKRRAGSGGQPKPGAVYVPTAGYIDLYYDSTVALSFESGSIRAFITLGYITATPMCGPLMASAVRKYGGWANYSDLASAPIPGPAVPHFIPGGIWTTIPNDGVGVRNDLRFLPLGVTKLYEPATQELYLEELSLGVSMQVRVNLTFVPLVNNTEAAMRIQFNAFGGWTLTRRLGSFNDGAGIEYQESRTFDFFVVESAYGGSRLQVYVRNDTNLYVQGYYIHVD